MSRRIELLLPHIDAARTALAKHAPLPSAKAGEKATGGFVFVESVLVAALRSGDWVLLDNVNSAPPETLERLNSLLEQDRMLNLYEAGDGKEFRDRPTGAGQEAIHPDFRIFATANTRRVHSNKLSAAFLNRMIRIWLPELDCRGVQLNVDSTGDARTTDLLDLVLAQCIGVSGGREIANLAVEFHLAVKDKEAKKGLTLMAGYSFSFRSLQFACRTMCYLIKEKAVPPLIALAWGLARSYTSCISDPGERSLVLEVLERIARARQQQWLGQRLSFTHLAAVSNRRSALDILSNTIADTMIALERSFCQLIASVLLTCDTEGSGGPAYQHLCDATISFLQIVVVPQQNNSTV